MHKIVLKVAVELSATFLLGARIASIASFIETFKGSLILHTLVSRIEDPVLTIFGLYV